MQVSILQHERDTAPQVYELTWDDLAGLLSKHDFRATKEGAPLFSPATLIGGRKKANVSAINFGVLDFDDVPVDQFLAALRTASQFDAFAYSSWSQPEAAASGQVRARLVVPLSRACSPDEWSDVHSRLVAYFGSSADPKCKDTTRCYYVPSLPVGCEAHALTRRAENWASGARVFDVNGTARAPAAANENATKGPPRIRSETLARAVEIARTDPPSIEGQGGDAALFEVACRIVRGLHLSGDEVDRAALFHVMLEHFNPRCMPPWDESRVRYKLDEALNESTRPWGFLIRTEIQISNDEHGIADQVIRRIAECSDLYTSNQKIAEIIEERTIDPRGRETTSATVREVPLAHLRDEIARLCNFQRWTEKRGLVAAHVPEWLPAAVAARGRWAMRSLIGILEAPSIRPDGSIIQVPGYDESTGYVFIPTEWFPPVPNMPTRDDARRALDDLREVFCDFPYASAADASVPLAAILAAVGRPAIAGSVPAFLLDASMAGSGKGLQAGAISMITRGRDASPVRFPTGDEQEKVLSGYAIKGSPLIVFDNLNGPFAGDALDKCLTATDTVDLRVLGRSEIRTLKWRAVVLVTGNNLTTDGDTTRRCLRARLEPAIERPEERKPTEFRHWPLLPWVRENRPRLVTAALTVLRAHALAGRPAPSSTMGSFESFHEIVIGALTWAGAADPSATQTALRESGADDDSERVRVLVEGFRRHDASGRGITIKQLVEQSTGDFELRSALQELDPLLDVPRLAKTLRRFEGRVVGEWRLRKLAKCNQGVPWKAERVAAGR